MSKMGQGDRCINRDSCPMPEMCPRYSSRNYSSAYICARTRYEGEEGAAIFGRLLACRQQPAGGVVGDPGSSRLLPIPPAPPDATDRPTVKKPPQRSTRRGADGLGTRSGLDVGRATPHNPRHPHLGATTTEPHRRSAVSRASRPARSRSEAGASADRSKRRRVRAVSARLD